MSALSSDPSAGPASSRPSATGSSSAGPSWATWCAALGFPLLGILVGTLGLFFTGAAFPQLVGDSGVLGRFGLPAARFVFETAAAITAAALVLATFVIPRAAPRRVRHKDRKQSSAAGGFEGDGESDVELDRGWLAAIGVAQASSVVWTLSAAAVLVLTYVDVAGSQAYSGDLSAQLAYFVSSLNVGRYWTFIVVVVAFVSTLVFALRSFAGIATAMVFSFAALVPLALMGHSTGAEGHTTAVNSIGLHLVGIVLWLGGLLVLALIARSLTDRTDLRTIVERYSALALFSFVLVVYSGFVNASLRMGSLADWTTPYGVVMLVKLALTLVLGGIGFRHRRSVIAGLGAPTAGGAGRGATGSAGRGASAPETGPSARGAAPRRLFWRLVGVEALIFGAVMALGVVLSRSQPPVPDEPPPAPTPAEILTSSPLPPRPSWGTYFTQWEWDPVWVVVAVGLSVAYVYAFLKLRRRGDAWPVLRVVAWVLGMVLLFWVTSGGPAVYGKVVFSGHMIQHMLIVMVVPIPMVMGAPITLLMRAIAPRRDGSRGFREWILILVHSRYLRFFAHPIVACVNFAGSLVVFYYSGIMQYALATHLGHELMMLHFLAAGYLFAQSLIGIDPGVNRFPFPVRLLMLLITMAFHAFFGISIMSNTSLIEGDWYGNIGHDWGFSALEDQQTGGEIAWGIGEFPAVLLAIGVAIQWTKSSEREAKRSDRAADRDEDAELRKYNAMLSRLKEHDDSM
ncbi:cytochrome c oxidase assembly protein [Brevibacterium samyangense]|uniref:Cytochrome c oxidase assembly protein n=1 Tax=Brevibacterium samyangense TaxID=366888 RepID=A0ABP5ENP1_9MICO